MITNICKNLSNTAKTGIAALATVCLLGSAAPAFAGTEPGYSHDNFTGAVNPDWMTFLPDSLKLSYMSIPGTHDSMSQTGGDIVQTQSMDLTSQLISGIRVLDIRILFEFNQFDLCHGIIPQPGTFDSVMETISNYLHEFPKETVLMRISDETNGLGNTNTFEQTFQGYWAKYSNVFWQNSSHETNPTLGELRGKVVVLRDFTATGSYGLNYSAFNAQDNYNLTTNWDLYNKWTGVKNQLISANLVGKVCAAGTCITLFPGNEDRQYINYLSGATGAFPYFVASGKSDPSTNGPLLATGETTPGWNNYPDFPRINCFLGICTIAFEGTNNLTYDWLTQAPRKRVGIIMADFPGYGLIDQTIALNRVAASGAF